VEAAVMTLHAYLAPLEKPRHSVRTAEELNKCTDDQLRGVIRDWLDRQYNTDERSKPKLLEVGAVCLPLPMVKVRSDGPALRTTSLLSTSTRSMVVKRSHAAAWNPSVVCGPRSADELSSRLWTKY
jgi:hypothetical protein